MGTTHSDPGGPVSSLDEAEALSPLLVPPTIEEDAYHYDDEDEAVEKWEEMGVEKREITGVYGVVAIASIVSLSVGILVGFAITRRK